MGYYIRPLYPDYVRTTPDGSEVYRVRVQWGRAMGTVTAHVVYHPDFPAEPWRVDVYYRPRYAFGRLILANAADERHYLGADIAYALNLGRSSYRLRSTRWIAV